MPWGIAGFAKPINISIPWNREHIRIHCWSSLTRLLQKNWPKSRQKLIYKWHQMTKHDSSLLEHPTYAWNKNAPYGFMGKKTASVPVVYGFFPCFLFRVSWVPYIFTAASVEPIESAACWSCRISSCGSCCSFTREKVWTSMMVVEGPLLLFSWYRIFVYIYIYVYEYIDIYIYCNI